MSSGKREDDPVYYRPTKEIARKKRVRGEAAVQETDASASASITIAVTCLFVQKELGFLPKIFVSLFTVFSTVTGYIDNLKFLDDKLKFLDNNILILLLARAQNLMNE